MRDTNLFLRPAAWGLGPGPSRLQSIDEAITAVELWLAVTPDDPRYLEERRRMLALRDVLNNARHRPGQADLQSAKLAIKGMVRFALPRQQRRLASIPRIQFERTMH